MNKNIVKLQLLKSLLGSWLKMLLKSWYKL